MLGSSPPRRRAPGAAVRCLLGLGGVLVLVLSGCGAGNGPESSVFTDPSAVKLADAVRDGDAAKIARVVDAGADPDAKGAKQLPMLQFAMLNQQRGGFTALLDAGADPGAGDSDGRTAVHLAAMADTTGWLRTLFDRNVSPDTPNTVTGAPPLNAALDARREENVALLLAAGADPDRTDRQDQTPLHHAALVADVGGVLTLLEAGADPRARDRSGATFQGYLYGADEDLLNAETKRGLEKIREFLRDHDVEVESP